MSRITYLADADVDALASSSTVATLLPGVEFSTRQPYPGARRLLAAGATVALATDCNPGSCFTSSMAFCVALAVREMRMTWCCWTRRRTPTWPTGRACRWSPRSGGPGSE